MPFFTTTQEFFRAVKDRLSENGILMMNVLSVRPGPDLIAPFVRTARSVFPSVFFIGSGNYILVASRNPLGLKTVQDKLKESVERKELAEVMERARSTLRVVSADDQWPIFTDDRNDVEFRTFRMLHGG